MNLTFALSSLFLSSLFSEEELSWRSCHQFPGHQGSLVCSLLLAFYSLVTVQLQIFHFDEFGAAAAAAAATLLYILFSFLSMCVCCFRKEEKFCTCWKVLSGREERSSDHLQRVVLLPQPSISFLFFFVCIGTCIAIFSPSQICTLLKFCSMLLLLLLLLLMSCFRVCRHTVFSFLFSGHSASKVDQKWKNRFFWCSCVLPLAYCCCCVQVVQCVQSTSSLMQLWLVLFLLPLLLLFLIPL